MWVRFSRDENGENVNSSEFAWKEVQNTGGIKAGLERLGNSSTGRWVLREERNTELEKRAREWDLEDPRHTHTLFSIWVAFLPS